MFIQKGDLHMCGVLFLIADCNNFFFLLMQKVLGIKSYHFYIPWDCIASVMIPTDCISVLIDEDSKTSRNGCEMFGSGRFPSSS